MSTSPTLSIPSPIPTSLAAPATTRPILDPQPKVLQIAAVIARIALSTIATVTAFVFLPLPFAIVATAAVVVANIAICFCRCTGQTQRSEGSLVRKTSPIPSPSQPKSTPNIPTITATSTGAHTIIRPEPQRANTDSVELTPMSQSPATLPITGAVDASAPFPRQPTPAEPATNVDLGTSQFPNGPALAGTIHQSAEQPPSLDSSDLTAGTPQPPRRMNVLTSEMPSIICPTTLDHLPMEARVLAAPAAHAPSSPARSLREVPIQVDSAPVDPLLPSTLLAAALLTSLPGEAAPSGDLPSPSPQAMAIAPPPHLGVSDREPSAALSASATVRRTHSLGSAGFQTLTRGHRGRFAHSLTAAAAAPGSRSETAPQRRIRLQPKDLAPSLIEDARRNDSDSDESEATLPGTIPAGFGEKDVSI
jgi:hypothetical protein